MALQDFGVIMNTKEVKDILSFAQMEGGFCDFRKEVTFLRFIGYQDAEAYLKEIAKMDEMLQKKQKQLSVGYLRLHQLDTRLSTEQVEGYLALLEKKELPFRFENEMWQRAMEGEMHKVVDLYRKVQPQANVTMVQNFVVKLYGLMERYMPQLFLRTKVVGRFPKFVVDGTISVQEYLFLWFLAHLGCDVLYLNPAEDLPPKFGMLLECGQVQQGTQRGKVEIPLPLIPTEVVPETPERKERVSVDLSHLGVGGNQREVQMAPRPSATGEPLNYEALAAFAPSVVMIHVFDEEEKCMKTGSGVFINAKGYILTNFHVVSQGAYFGISLEEQTEKLYTDNLVKYHYINDLALLRVDIQSNPIPVYGGETPLRRGQQVVAIGSPLGLFNTVSDGIISGFRQLDEVSMVQFTAPTSPGSSGGALLDLYGNLIGLLTAGFDGQNLNLAVDYKTIRLFLQGFL